MRIFTRYILREVVSYALLGGVLFTFVLFMRDLGRILDLVVRDSASLADVFRIFACMLPNALNLTIPMAVLVGILLGLSRLAADSEITAMRACGIGAFTFVRIVSILSFSALTLGLVNSLYFTPRAAGSLLKLETDLKNSGVSVEIEPRVFYEDLKNYVLYVQDVRLVAGVQTWTHVFLADITQPASPNVTTASKATVSSASDAGDAPGLHLHLMNGAKHEITSTNSYDLTTFTSIPDLPLQLDSHDDTHISRMNTSIQALTLGELWRRSSGIGPTGRILPPADRRAAGIELNLRFSYPFACIVLMLIGVPLGLSSKRGGKSTGFVLTLLLVFAYYLLSEFGVGFAKSGKLSPMLGVWGANLIFALFGLLMLQQLAGAGRIITFFTSVASVVTHKLSAMVPARLVTAISRLSSQKSGQPADALSDLSSAPYQETGFGRTSRQPNPTLVQRLRNLFKTNFPLLLDEYVMRSYAANFALALGAFALLVLVFTFFELIGDIIRNQTPFVVVGRYLFSLLPYIVNEVTPLCSLLAVLVTFGALNRSSELTAMKATGISLYRVVAPILVLAAILAGALFAFDETYLPDANRRQEQLRAQIKGKPAQTFLRPDRKWISGQSPQSGPDNQSGDPAKSTPARIFYYQFFDPVQNAFANLTVFEFDPQTFTLERRIFASTVHWDPSVNSWIFDNGWQLRFAGEAIAPGSYQTFTVSTFPEIHEQPAYFTKEDIPSKEMTYGELDRYIAELRQSGTPHTAPLSVQLERKIADPIVTLIMAILAVPFAVSMGKRGGLAGIATAIGVAISYWFVALTFSSMGNIDTLPPLLAAWSPDLLFGIAGAYLLLRTPT